MGASKIENDEAITEDLQLTIWGSLATWNISVILIDCGMISKLCAHAQLLPGYLLHFTLEI